MPFIVTTTRPGHKMTEAHGQGGGGVLRVCECGMQSDIAENGGGCPYAVSRRAVAALEEVGDAARDVVFAVKGIDARSRLLAEMDAWDNRSTLTLTLPDGTVIEVETTTYHALWHAVPWDSGLRGGPYCETDGDQNIAAFNAAQEAVPHG